MKTDVCAAFPFSIVVFAVPGPGEQSWPYSAATRKPGCGFSSEEGSAGVQLLCNYAKHYQQKVIAAAFQGVWRHATTRHLGYQKEQVCCDG